MKQYASAVLVALLWTGFACSPAKPTPTTRTPLIKPAPHKLSAWPWPNTKKTALGPGLTLTVAQLPGDTRVELFRVDFNENPSLRLDLYDQDEDDGVPYDNAADYTRTADQIHRHLEARGGSKILLAWNGPFFAYDFKGGRTARHIGPVVQKGKLRYNVGNHRWTLASRNGRLQVIHLPDRKSLEAERFDFAVAGVQALIDEGKPLELEPFPRYENEIKKPPVPSSPAEAGHIPIVDHMQTSRTSLGWSRDGKILSILIVTEEDHELGSKLGLKRGEAQRGGMTLADLQKFWTSYGAWGSINSDGGDVTQRIYRRQDGSVDVLKPRNGQGTLMTFTISEK